MDFYELEEKVIHWAHDKQILQKATPLAQANKILEEVNELLFALTVKGMSKEGDIYNRDGFIIFDSDEEIKDAFGDILVTIIIGATMQGLNLTECLESAYNVIKNRTGKIINGQFQKDK